MTNLYDQNDRPDMGPESTEQQKHQDQKQPENKQQAKPQEPEAGVPPEAIGPNERKRGSGRPGARGTAAMDPHTRQEVARKGGLAVSRNKQHMSEIGRKGGQSVSKNREHM